MMQEWLGKTVDRDDLTRHDKWCCMMLPRLKLLRELLRQDGAIFISIDDNEVHHGARRSRAQPGGWRQPAFRTDRM